ncbi:MAG: hypothetical protein V4755_17065 [Curtobacterium sp.]
MQLPTPLVRSAMIVVAASTLALSGCAASRAVEPSSAASVASAGSGSPTAVASTPAETPAATATAPAGSPTQATGATGTAAAGAGTAFPSGQPPRPGAQDAYPEATSIAGLQQAIAATPHPGLQICDGDLVSLVTASGDLRGDGGQQYLVDTTCSLATASSPDEVAVYDRRGGGLVRSAVLSEFTANRPKPSAYPYLWQGHTVVLAYDGGASYRLVRLSPRGETTSDVRPFR